MLCSSAAVVDLRSEVSSSTGGLIVMREWFFFVSRTTSFPCRWGKMPNMQQSQNRKGAVGSLCINVPTNLG